MRVGTMTFHRALNCGAVLQAWALVQAVGARGHRCEVIDYRCAYIEHRRGRFLRSAKTRRKSLAALVHLPRRTLQVWRFDRFLKKNLPLSARAYRPEDLQTWRAQEYDRVIAGSDQVWNLKLTAGDGAYALAFVGEEKRCAYAAGIGRDAQAAIDEPMARAIGGFRALSLREESGAAFVRRLTGREDVCRVCDPVLLVDRERWRKLAGGRTARAEYVFVYVVGRQSEQMRAAVDELCKRTGLRARVFQNAHEKGARGRYCRSYGPTQFLRSLIGARYVVTNSFHAAAFSILFHKDFWAFITSKNREGDERFNTLAETYGLSERFVERGAPLPDLTAPADFLRADAALEDERRRAGAFLEFCMEESA